MPDHAHAPSIDDLLAHGDFLRALARRLVTDEATANDVVQDVWVRALQRPPESAHSLAGWCARVVRNLVRDRASSEQARGERERARAIEPLAGMPEPAEAVGERAAAIDELGRAFAALPATYRDVLYLRYYEDLRPRAIAEQLGCSTPTVKTRLRRGLELLRQDLRQRLGGERNFVLHLLPLAIVHARSEAARSSSAAGGALPRFAPWAATVGAGVGVVLLAGLAVRVGSGWTSADTAVVATAPPSATRAAPPSDATPLRERGLEGQVAPATRAPVAAPAPAGTELRGRVVYAGTGQGVPFYRFEVHAGDGARGGEGDERRRSESIVTARDGSFAGELPFGRDVRVVFPDAIPREPAAAADAASPAIGPSEETEVAARIASASRASRTEPRVDERRVARERAEEVFEVALGPTYFVDLCPPPGYTAADFEAAITGWKHQSLHCRGPRTRIAAGEPPWVRFAPPDGEVHAEPWIWYLEVVSRDGTWSGKTRVDWVHGVHAATVAVQLEPQTTLDGVVRDASGVPLAGVGVRLQEPGGERTHYRSTAADGRYAFELLEPGRYVQYVREEHFRPWKEPMELGGGPARRDVVLERRPPGGAIAGTITSTTGMFRERTFLFLEGRGDQDAWARRDVRWEERNGAFVGRFEFPDVGHGTYRLACNTVAGVPITDRVRTLTPPATDLTFVVEDDRPTLALDFHVVAAATGVPLEAYWVLTRVEGGYIDAELVHPGAPPSRPLCEGADIEWWIFGDGFRPRGGRIGGGAPAAPRGPIEVRLEPGFGTLFIAIAIESYRHVPGVTLLADGVPVGATDDTGQLVLDLPRVPETLGVDPERWWIYSDGAHRSHIDPRTGAYDVSDRAHVAAYLRPVE